MKQLFIEAQKKINLDESKLSELESSLPNTIYIAYSIQYRKLALEMRRAIKKRILGFSQVLGCSKLETKAEAILLIGEARFHALNLALNSGKPVFIFDNYSLREINRREIEKMQQEDRAKYTKFLASDNIGILMSMKKGQNHPDLAKTLKKKIETQGKKAFVFVSDNISISELENFPGIEIWVNTACPGLALDSRKIINHSCLKLENGEK